MSVCRLEMPGRSSSSSRSSRSSSFSRSSKPSYSYSSPKSPVPAPTIAPPSPISSTVNHNHQVQQPGFFSNMWTGFGLGAGQSIAMNMFRSDPKVTHVHENAPAVPIAGTSSLEKNLPKEFVQCMKENNNDKDLCKQFLE